MTFCAVLSFSQCVCIFGTFNLIVKSLCFSSLLSRFNIKEINSKDPVYTLHYYTHYAKDTLHHLGFFHISNSISTNGHELLANI